MKLKEILNSYPLRVSLTDFCNLHCFFCSNEGMDLACKNLRHIDLEALKYLLKLLKDNGLNGLSLTGGEPSLYPHINELLGYIEDLKFNQTFFHTNGAHLTKQLIDEHLIKFSKVAVSIHTVNFDIWHKLTGGNQNQFDHLFSNLSYLSKYSKEGKLLVEIKIVSMKGVNDSALNYRSTLDFCSENRFKFKFLNFEPITPDQRRYQMNMEETVAKIESLGAEKLPADEKFRGQKSYLPLNWFKYKNTKGVVIEIGCGQPEVCKTCYKSNEIYLDPNLELKPCHAHKFSIPLKPLIDKKEDSKILDAIVTSREFLKKKPGIGSTNWLNN